MKYAFPKGSTSVIVPVFIQDSSSTTGAGLGSLVHTSSIVGGYLRPGGTGVALVVDEDVATEGTYAAPTTAGQVRIGTPANMRTGTYELHLHNDLLASGADAVFITLGGATNMADLVIEIQLTDVDLNDSVRGGMTALPNAAADAAGGLPISDAGGLDMDGTDTNVSAVLTDTGTTGVAIAAGAITATAIATDAITAAKIAADAIGASELATNAITTAQLADGTITAAKIGADAITEAKIADNAIAAEHIATDAIDADALAAGALTEIENAVWNAAVLSHVVAGSIAEQLQDIDATTIATITDTAQIGVAGAGLTDLGGMSTTMKGEVNTEVADVLKTDTVTLPGQEAPPLAPTFEEMISWLYKVLRNRTSQTATLWQLYADDESTVDAKATVSDDATTAIKQEIVTGP